MNKLKITSATSNPTPMADLPRKVGYLTLGALPNNIKIPVNGYEILIEKGRFV